MIADVVSNIISKCQTIEGIKDDLENALSCYNDMMEDMKSIDNRDTEVTDKLPWAYRYLLNSTQCVQIVVAKINFEVTILQSTIKELLDYTKEHDIDY
jgi:ABC-type Zn uptake system ZnuABC Zn-binding protein ZnuA